jgi:hypothetical protein
MGSGIGIGIGIETGTRISIETRSSLRTSRILVNVPHLTDVYLFRLVTNYYFLNRSQIIHNWCRKLSVHKIKDA